MALRAIVDNLTLPELGARLQQTLAVSAQRRLLASVDTTLVLSADELINSANGESRRLSPALATEPARQIAQAAKSLFPVAGAHILLLLPPSDFIGTRFALGVRGGVQGGVLGESLLRSALTLQAPSLLPAYDKPLLLALNGQHNEAVALWYPEEQATALFEAFAAEGLQLVAVQPRVLAAGAALPEASATLLDEDAHHLTLVELRAGAVQTWHSVHRRDLEDGLLRDQWQTACASAASAAPHLLRHEHWSALRIRLQPLPSYCFFPAGALRRGRLLLARQQRRGAALAAAIALGLLVLPFAGNWLRIALLEREVAALQDASTEARRSQAAVYAMEDAWGPVAAYPQQDVAALLLTLDALIDNSLSSFALNKGVVDISGFSPDPALLIEQLSEQETFYNVGQSRGTSGGGAANRGDQFGIRMNVSGVDFPAYESAYPDAQD
ncbi:MAG: hypothetical protein ACO3PV_04045 [Pseudohongiellaceae bacterium]